MQRLHLEMRDCGLAGSVPQPWTGTMFSRANSRDSGACRWFAGFARGLRPVEAAKLSLEPVHEPGRAHRQLRSVRLLAAQERPRKSEPITRKSSPYSLLRHRHKHAFGQLAFGPAVNSLIASYRVRTLPERWRLSKLLYGKGILRERPCVGIMPKGD